MIDKNDAPEGYEAIEASSGCNGCAFYVNNQKTCKPLPGCFIDQRNDGQSVIFVKKQEPKNTVISILSKYWMVHGNGPTKMKHKTKEAAITEAKRLSMQHPNQVFVVLEAIECYHTPVPKPIRYDMK